jgi:hypothetical protein
MARAGQTGKTTGAATSARGSSRRLVASNVQVNNMDVEKEPPPEVQADAAPSTKEYSNQDPGRKRKVAVEKQSGEDCAPLAADRAAGSSKNVKKRQKPDKEMTVPVEQHETQAKASPPPLPPPPLPEEQVEEEAVAHQEAVQTASTSPSQRPSEPSKPSDGLTITTTTTTTAPIFSIPSPRLKTWVTADTGDTMAEASMKLVKDIFSPVTSLASLQPVPSSAGLSFRNYMMGEASSGYNAHMRDHGEGEDSAERRPDVLPFMRVPLKLELTLNVGFLVCLDSFLFNFTLLPLRCLSDMLSCARAILEGRFGGAIPEDLSRMMLVVVCMLGLNHVDISYLYHYIRGQMSSYIKLYVIYNVLEVFDRLFCSLGQDVFEQMSISSQTGYGDKERAENEKDKPVRGTWALFLFYVSLSMLYVIGHATVLLIQVVVLNVAINSNNNALITLLVANNFTEIKVMHNTY